MNFTINSKYLFNILNKISGIINTNNVYPILENFHFKCQDNILKITSSDMQTYMSTNIYINNTIKYNTFVIPAKILLDTLKAMPDQEIDFKKNNNIIEIKSLMGIYKIPIGKGEDYPIAPIIDLNEKIKINNLLFSEIIKSVPFIVNDDELRPSISGVLCEIKDNKINFVSTDGHRLIKFSINNDNNAVANSFIIPIRVFNTLKYNIINKNIEEYLSINCNEKLLSININNILLISRLIEEDFPNYNAVIPTDNNNEIIINKNEILNALKRGFIYSNKINYQINFKITNDKMIIDAENKEFLSSSSENIRCSYNGKYIEIGFNAKSLMEMINVISDSHIKMKISTNDNPILLMPFNQKDNIELIMLIMPLAI